MYRYLFFSHKLKFSSELRVTQVVLFITTLDLSLLLPSSLSLISLLSPTGTVIPSNTHARQQLGMCLCRLKRRQTLYMLGMTSASDRAVFTLTAFSLINGSNWSKQVCRKALVMTILLNNLSSVESPYLLCNSISASSVVHGEGRLDYTDK